MASFLWTSVFIFLCLELGLTLILVIPVPRKIRNWVCRATTQWHLKQKLQPVLWGVGVALSVALLDCLSLLQFIFEDDSVVREMSMLNRGVGIGVGGVGTGLLAHQKEKEYKTERNMYLAGFALTLLFVIGRITDLMQEHVELEDDLEKVKLSGKHAVDTSSGEPQASEIEMKPLKTKKDD